MTDVSKAIYVGEWELYPCKGKVYIQSTTHPKIVLTDAEAMHVWHLLNVWVERNARRMGGGRMMNKPEKFRKLNTKVADLAFLKDYKRLFHQNQLLRSRIDQLMNSGNKLSSRVRQSLWFEKHRDDTYITFALDEWDSSFHEMFQEMQVEGDLLKDLTHRLARYNTNHEVWDVL